MWCVSAYIVCCVVYADVPYSVTTTPKRNKFGCVSKHQNCSQAGLLKLMLSGYETLLFYAYIVSQGVDFFHIHSAHTLNPTTITYACVLYFIHILSSVVLLVRRRQHRHILPKDYCVIVYFVVIKFIWEIL